MMSDAPSLGPWVSTAAAVAESICGVEVAFGRRYPVAVVDVDGERRFVATNGVMAISFPAPPDRPLTTHGFEEKVAKEFGPEPTCWALAEHRSLLRWCEMSRAGVLRIGDQAHRIDRLLLDTALDAFGPTPDTVFRMGWATSYRFKRAVLVIRRVGDDPRRGVVMSLVDDWDLPPQALDLAAHPGDPS